MKKFVLGILVALLVCATGLFAGLGHRYNGDPENEKIPVWSIPEGDVPIA